jgi:hypothetical protein
MLEHPEISWIERTGYPSWMQETEGLGDGYDYERDDDDYDEETIE